MGISTSSFRTLRTLAAVAAVAFAVAACEDETTGPGTGVVEGTLTLDATDPASFTYLTLSDGGSEVSVPDPSTSTAWDLAFRRFSVKLNGGVAGPGTVAAVNLMNNASVDSATIVNFTAADADEAWDAVTVDDITGKTFVEDGIVEDDSGPWFRYDPMAGTLVANTGAAWKLKEADGGHALFRISSMDVPGSTMAAITVQFRRQDAGADLGAIDSVAVTFPAGPPATVFLDLETASEVTASGCNWDLSVSSVFEIAFNDACGAGTFPLDASEDFTAVTTADDAPEYGGFLSVISGAFPSTVGDASGLFWYDIEGNNYLWPTYNVFLVRIGTSVYKVQVTDYYNDSQESGHPTLRFELLQ
jgi:hypothetical protein